MTTSSTIFTLTLATIIWGCVLGIQRPPPRYSQQYMPQTSFSCRNKIVGSYYADPETDCQLFHVCVSVAGSIQDYRFLCPNDTAFDQESQTCADWYDVDCEAATLYYASDNFDLYRIGSGLESLHYDSIRSDFEPQDHLQRSESNDPIRSPLNSYNPNNYKDSESPRKSNVRANDNSNQYNSRNQKQINNEFEKEKAPEPEKKVNLRKINRKPVNNAFTNAYTTKSTTIAPAPTQGRFNDQSFGQNLAYSTTSLRPSSPAPVQKSNQATSTPRPTTKYAVTTLRSTANSQDTYTSYQTTTAKANYHNNFNNFNRFETTAKLTNVVSTHYAEPQSYSGQFSQATPSTTKQPISDYQQHNQANNYEQRSYNNYDNKNNHNYNHNNNNNYNINSQRTNSSTYPSSTAPPNTYDNNYNNNNHNNNNNNNYNANYESSKNIADYNANTYTANTYAPTTYSPMTKKFLNNRQYYDKSTTLTTKSAQYTETDSTKASNKVTNYKGYQNYETSTRSYDFGRSSVGLGFSPSSVNHLAENFRSTTPTPRRAASPTTYNPNNFNVNMHAPQSQVTQQKSTYHQNQSAKQYSTTTKYFEKTTTRPKITKKNDYDYAYYDNGPLEYDNIELEHVGSNKESVKIS